MRLFSSTLTLGDAHFMNFAVSPLT